MVESNELPSLHGTTRFSLCVCQASPSKRCRLAASFSAVNAKRRASEPRDEERLRGPPCRRSQRGNAMASAVMAAAPTMLAAPTNPSTLPTPPSHCWRCACRSVGGGKGQQCQRHRGRRREAARWRRAISARRGGNGFGAAASQAAASGGPGGSGASGRSSAAAQDET